MMKRKLPFYPVSFQPSQLFQKYAVLPEYLTPRPMSLTVKAKHTFL